MKKNIFLWALYDFANSIVMIVFFLYFSQWLVIDKGISDFGYNLLFIIATALLICTAPVLGALSDRYKKSFSYLKKNTLVIWILYLLLSLVILLFPEQKVLAMAIFVIGNFSYQLAFSFYIPLLTEISTPEKRGLISGIGNASNWLGQIAGLLIALPFASGAFYFFGEPGRAQVFLPVTLIFILLSLPMILFYKTQKLSDNKLKIGLSDFKKEYKSIFSQAKSLFIIPGVGMFLLSFFFFNDAILTASNNFPIVLERVFGAPDTKKTFLLALILVTSAIGSILFGYLGDKLGLKKVLLWILGGWVFIFPLIATSQTIGILTIWVTIMGLLFGGVWAVSRALLSKILPEDKLTHGFSFYVISERFASFFGPLAWSGIVMFAPSENGLNYRIAMISMTAFIIVGLILMKKVKYSYGK